MALNGPRTAKYPTPSRPQSRPPFKTSAICLVHGSESSCFCLSPAPLFRAIGARTYVFSGPARPLFETIHVGLVSLKRLKRTPFPPRRRLSIQNQDFSRIRPTPKPRREPRTTQRKWIHPPKDKSPCGNKIPPASRTGYLPRLLATTMLLALKVETL